MYILDTNILIYSLAENQRVKEQLLAIESDDFAISVITRFEVLIGKRKDNATTSEIAYFINGFDNLVIDTAVIEEAIMIKERTSTKLKFKDLLIAATAKVHNLTLITADKDFLKIDGLKVKRLCL